MEERISAAESRGAAPGLIFQSFLNALQSRNSKTLQSSKSVSTSSESETLSNPPSRTADEETVHGDLDEVETWRESFVSTRKKINQTWEQYSPTFKDKVQRYSPNPLRKLKTLFTLSEEKDPICDAGEMEGEGDVSNSDGNQIGSAEDDEQAVGAVDSIKHCSSQTGKVPSGVSILGDCDNCLRKPAKSNALYSMDRHPPYIVLQEPDSNGNDVKTVDIHSDHLHRRKSPLTVQEWVDHLPLKHKLNDKDCDDSLGSKDLDNHEPIPQEEKKSLLAQKLSREASVQSSSSLDSLLDSRRPDPVEVLLNLGFGGIPGVDMNNCRIPKRFLVPSKCKGGDWNEFLKRELLQAQNFECSSLGFRGLSGPSYRRPSAIVANIMEKLRERAAPRHPTKSKFSCVARRVLNEKSVLNKLVSPSQSVLSPDSRKFLDNQGKISPEVPRRRIIFGQKSFAFGNDGEFIEVESHSSATKAVEKESPTSADSSSADSDFEESKMNPATLTSPEVMLKLRRSSLQRQKKVEEEPDLCEADIQMEESGVYRTSEGNGNTQSDEKFAKEDKKIPTRFVLSTNLRQLVEDERSKSSEEMKLELEEEINTLSQKIQSASNAELSSILLQVRNLEAETVDPEEIAEGVNNFQMKELRTRLENSS